MAHMIPILHSDFININNVELITPSGAAGCNVHFTSGITKFFPISAQMLAGQINSSRQSELNKLAGGH